MQPAPSLRPQPGPGRARNSSRVAREGWTLRWPESWLPFFLSGDLFVSSGPVGDPPRQAFQLLTIEHSIVHHAKQKLFGRSAAEAVNDALHGADSHVLARVRGFINERTAFNLVCQIALFFQAPQNRPHGGVFHRAG